MIKSVKPILNADSVIKKSRVRSGFLITIDDKSLDGIIKSRNLNSMRVQSILYVFSNIMREKKLCGPFQGQEKIK